MSNLKKYHARGSRPFLVAATACSVPCRIMMLLFIFFNMLTIAGSRMNIISVGALLDENTRIGKEMKTAMKLAERHVNNSSKDHKISLHFQNPGESPLQAVYAAEELVKEKNVQSIIGLTTWEETALVASIGNKVKVPIVSFAASAIEKSVLSKQWPFLVQMGPNIKEQIKCTADIVNSFGWRKVIVIYEVDSHGSDSGAFARLSDALWDVGVGIEHRLVLPPFSSLSEPTDFLRKEVASLSEKQARVFVVLQSTLTMGIHLFEAAKELKLVEKESAWIISEPLAALLDHVNTSVISSMEGALGVATYFHEGNRSFQAFKQQFQQLFRSDYHEEENSEPSIYALRAFDSIIAIANAIKKGNSSMKNSTRLWESLLSSNFMGLSGLISFRDGELAEPAVFEVINVVGKRYKELAIWSTNLGFSRIVDAEESIGNQGLESLEEWAASINWPGDLKRIPRGWAMPTDARPLRIGVPGRTSFEKFVKVTWDNSRNRWICCGFCCDVFYAVLEILEQRYTLPYEFIKFNGSYDELVDSVTNKTFDAVVGDITILASRSRDVEFTQPFAESGLRMVVPVKSQAENQGWIFLQPFTAKMWAVTGAILLYTVVIVWLLERRVNPEFGGRWWSQLNTALWFTCSSLFFAQREKVHNNYTKVVVIVWLFVVLSLTSSYTANLSSLLTVPRLLPTVTDIEWLKENNAKIGCDGDSFVRKYMEDVLGFKSENIMVIKHELDYEKEFKSKNISAAFFEIPYQKAFLNYYCEGYMVAGNTSSFDGDRFGGFGFVFQKGSPIASDASQAILTLLEYGRLKQLEIEYFSPSPRCSQSSDEGGSLHWESFWGLYLFSAGTSAFCYLLFCIHQLYKQWHLRPEAMPMMTRIGSRKSHWRSLRAAFQLSMNMLKEH